MKLFPYLLLVFLLPTLIFGQESEKMIPRDAAITFSINNISLLKKISMDDLVQYDFMEEVQSELFNGSTNGKTLKDAGFDFNQRISAFLGQTEDYQISGFTFGFTDLNKILQVFDNFEEIESHIPNVKVYRNVLNYMFVRGTSALIIRVEPSLMLIKSTADSIWRQGEYGFYIPDDNNINSDSSYYDDDSPYIEEDQPIDADSTLQDNSDEVENLDSIAENYWELRDSIRYEFQQSFLQKIATELFVNGHSLYTDYPAFQAQLAKKVDGVFYLDNSRNLESKRGVWQFQNIIPSLFSDTKALYEGNVITGELNIVGNKVVANIDAKYSEKLGKMYYSMTHAKFQKNFGKYIYKDALAYFTYNVNLKDAYHTSFDEIMKLFANEDDAKIMTSVLYSEIINEFVDVDNIFDTYQGSMFGSLNGYKRIPTTEIVYQYDENTFDYTEKEVQKDQDIPNLTIGFKTEKPEFLQKIARILSKTRPEIIRHGDYYEYKNAILNSIPLYFAVVDDIVLFSDDENLFTTHLDGYAKSERMNMKNAKKSKFTYINIDLDKALSKLPRELLNEKQNEILSTLLNKTGTIELKTTENTRENTKFQINYILNENIENNGKYLLDIINSLYTLTKD